MKKKLNVIISMGLIAIACVACKKDDAKDDSKRQKAAKGYEQLDYLQNSIVKIDSTNAFVERVYGVPLDKADTTVVSIGVDDATEALDIFKSWLAPDVEIKASNGVVTIDLKDKNGVSTGVVAMFTPAAADNMIAQVTFSSVNKLHHFSKIIFVTKTSWPNNSRSPYREWDTESYPTYDEGVKKWVCVREASCGNPGIMVYLSSGRLYIDGFTMFKSYAAPLIAREVSNILRSDWNTYSNFFAANSNPINQGYSNASDNGDYYWVNDFEYYFFAVFNYGICLRDGKIYKFDVVYRRPFNKYIQIRTFYEVN